MEYCGSHVWPCPDAFMAAIDNLFRQFGMPFDSLTDHM
jgi:hypothetical protein